MTVLFAIPGPTELVIIIAIVGLLFGGRFIGHIMKNFASGIIEGRKAVREISKAVSEPAEELKKEVEGIVKK